MNKKRHHYIPKAYLRSFCDTRGRINVYRKDEPEKVINQSPDKVGFRKYYYSQPALNGGRENKLEDLFSELESKWPPLVGLIRQGRDINDPERLSVLLDFIALQRFRVPAARDAAEIALAENLMSAVRVLDKAGRLPPKPPGCDDILDRIEIPIDPHESLIAMRNGLDGINKIFSEIGLGALHNDTRVPFLTSDNPVVWFDPSQKEELMRPYVWRPGGELVFMFPIAPDCLIYGHSSMRGQFESIGFGYGNLSDAKYVETINRQICRFAYEAVFAQERGQEALIKEHSGVSPVLEVSRLPGARGETLIHSMTFGRRRRKPKWRCTEDDTDT